MKKVIVSILTVIGVLWFWFAANQPNVWEAMTQNTAWSFFAASECYDGQQVYVTNNHYVWDDFNIYDTHWGQSNNYAYIYDRATTVTIVDPYSVFDFDDSFRFISNGKPLGIPQVKFIDNDGDMLPWTLVSANPDVNDGEIVAQVAISLYRQWFHVAWWPADYSMWYWPWPSGPQSTASFDNYYVWNYTGGLECFNYVVHYCGDGDIDTAQTIANLPWWNNNSVADEQCDPADPSHEGWGDQWCSASCEPINQTIDPPTCELLYTNIGNDNFLIHWYIDGSFYNPTYIYITPDTVEETTHMVLTNNGTWNHVSVEAAGTYTATLTVTNSAWSNTCQKTFVAAWQEEHICGDWIIDLPNDDWFNEQCDDWNNVNADGCKNDCTLNIPVCDLYVNPSVQTLWELVEFTAQKSSWAIYWSFDLDDGTTIQNFGMPYSYLYNNVGGYSPVLTVRNNYNPIAAWVTRPTNICGTSVEIIDQDPELVIDKILITTDPVGVWDFVDYEIVLTNNGDWISENTYLRDEMPASLELVSHSIVGISNFEVNEWQDTNGTWFVEYDNFDLDPWQTVTMSLRWQVRESVLPGQTTNCAFTSWDFDCEMYSLSNDPYILKYQRNKSNPNSGALQHRAASNTPGGMTVEAYTTWDINVNFGDIIKYKIKFANLWATYTNGWVRVLDHMPRCVDYVTASIHGVDDANFIQSIDINDRYILEYNWFDLEAWQQWYMIVEWEVMNTPECQDVEIYVNESSIYFANPLRVEESSTTATRIGGEAQVFKDSNVDVHVPWDDKTFILWVENHSPNPIIDIILEDIWPSGPCIEYIDWNGNGFTKEPWSLIWTNPGPLVPGKSMVLHIDAHILNDASCVNPDYINTVSLTYTEAWSEKHDQADYHFEVVWAPVVNVSLVKTADKTVVSSGDTIIYTIEYTNNGTVALDNYVLTDIWPAMVEFISATPFPNSIMNMNTWSILTWNFNTPLLPGESGEIVLEWLVQ